MGRLFFFRCRNCGSVEHRHWECPEQKNITNNVLCTRCGGAGHLASDCIQTEYVYIDVKCFSISLSRIIIEC